MSCSCACAKISNSSAWGAKLRVDSQLASGSRRPAAVSLNLVCCKCDVPNPDIDIATAEGGRREYVGLVTKYRLSMAMSVEYVAGACIIEEKRSAQSVRLPEDNRYSYLLWNKSFGSCCDVLKG